MNAYESLTRKPEFGKVGWCGRSIVVLASRVVGTFDEDATQPKPKLTLVDIASQRYVGRDDSPCAFALVLGLSEVAALSK
ncbi:MAG: hypothetical protein QOH16_705 [Gaiellaceae bacterium]|nr:hypothetical protein [Gaiellaceae bacterium]